MASVNKSTGLQIALVFTVMSTIIALVVAFLEYRTATDAESALAAERDQRTKTESERKVAATNLQNVRQFLGFPNTEEVGKPDADSDNTVIGQLRGLMTHVAPRDLTQATVAATLHRVGQELDTLQKERTALNSQTMELTKKLQGLRDEYQAIVDAHQKARTEAERNRSDVQAKGEEVFVKKEKELAERQQQIQTLRAESEAAKAQFAKSKAEYMSRINKLTKINVGLRNEKAKGDWRFEVPSGKIDYVDQDTRLVWINRGQRDNLRKGTTFSVYKQVNDGVARGIRDIKGAIEVTKVMPDMAEARITRQHIGDPIVEGDPIYTPLWAPNRKEKFAFVGLIDVDNDGVNDRDVLHDLVAASGGEIVDEVDDKGVRHPAAGAINVDTKFLVIGKIPDSYESKPEEKEWHQHIAQFHKKMLEEALEHGVRFVTLDDFLNYVGYEPGRRVWRPGVTPTWNLKQGMQGNVARPDAKGRTESTGQTSRAFTNPHAPQMESTGQNSKVFNK